MNRTPREWSETCDQCHGVGVIRKQERFTLWTPEEYAEAMPAEHVPAKLDAKHDVPSDAVICVARAGASIFDACKEGVDLARALGLAVAFEFNGAVAICRAGSDPGDIAKRWWGRAYGKTYEQSIRDR